MRARLPEWGHFWIRYEPRCWPDRLELWTDLGRGGLGRSGSSGRTGEGDGLREDLLGEPALDDLLYLPPVPGHRAPARDRVAVSHLERGTPVLVQLLPGDPVPPGGVVVVWDPLEALVAGDWSRVVPPDPSWVVVWPLLAGLTDRRSDWQQVCEQLAAAGVGTVQPLAPDLMPEERRRLVSRCGEESFEALFHAAPPCERGFSQIGGRVGLRPFWDRPLPRPPLRGAANLRLAGLLSLAGELCLRLGERESRAQGFFRAARWVDAAGYEVNALVRDGHLATVPHLEPESRELLTAAAIGGESEILEGLKVRYLGGSANAADTSPAAE